MSAEQAVVVGGGVAAVRTALALPAATLVHPGPDLLAEELDRTGARMLSSALAAAGVRLRPGRTVVQHSPGQVVLDDGESLPASAVLHPGPAEPAPGRPLTRLSAPGVDLLAIGPPGDGEREVRLHDPARGRYARLGLRDGRIASAVVLGLPRAIAALIQLYDRDLPVPADRLALLLGTPAALPGGAEPGPDSVLCHCANVTRRAVTDAWHAGACDVAALAAATRATTGCGGCGPDLRALCGTLAARIPAAAPSRPRELAEQPA